MSSIDSVFANISDTLPHNQQDTDYFDYLSDSLNLLNSTLFT